MVRSTKFVENHLRNILIIKPIKFAIEQLKIPAKSLKVEMSSSWDWVRENILKYTSTLYEPYPTSEIYAES